MERASSFARPGAGSHALALTAFVLLAPGCQWGGRLNWFDGMRAPEIADQSSVEQIVQVLNVNTLGTATQQGLKSWRDTSASVSVTGMVNVPATIAVEAPRNLRIRIAHPISRSELFDLGSNPDEFWVWARDAEPRGVMHVRHDEVDFVSQHLDLPIHPDWMMEVFGVVPLNPADYRREESDAGSRYVELVGHKTAPNGMQVANVIRVDMHRGVIVRRSLHAEDGTVLGIAEYAGHKRDDQSQLMLPREISLEVPAMGSGVTIHLKNVQLNPPPMQATVWQPPRIPGEPDVMLAEVLEASLQNSMPQVPRERGDEIDPGIYRGPTNNRISIGQSRTRDVPGIEGIGGNLRPDAWDTDEDSLPPRGIADVDPTQNWDIGREDPGSVLLMAQPYDNDARGGDAPEWGVNDPYAPAPVPETAAPSEGFREFEPTVFEPTGIEQAAGDQPAWAQ